MLNRTRIFCLVALAGCLGGCPEEGTPPAPQSDAIGSDSTQDASQDAAPDALNPDVTPDTAPDVTPDTAPDVTPDTAPDVTPDTAPDVTPDTAPDVTPDGTATDSGADSVGDAIADTAADSAVDTASDSAGDATGTDAVADVSTDAVADVSTDAVTDVGTDAVADVSTDAGTDAGADAGADVGTDAGADAGADVPVNPSGETCAEAIPVDLSTFPASVPVDNTGAADDYSGDGAGCGYSTGGADVVFSFTPDADGFYTFAYPSTPPAGPDVLIVVTNCEAIGTCVGSIDTFFGPLTVELTAGTLYFLIADAYDGSDVGADTLEVTYEPCQDACGDGATQCNGTAIETCATGTLGCLAWQETSDCASTAQPACDDSSGTASCVACVDVCVDGSTQCAGAVIQTCGTAADGCLGWSDTTDCAAEASPYCGVLTSGAQCWDTAWWAADTCGAGNALTVSDLPFSESASTCGFADDEAATCMGPYDGGQDAYYAITLDAPGGLVITMTPSDTYSAIAIDAGCPLNGASCLAAVGDSTQDPRVIPCTYYEAGTYHVKVDTWPSPDCVDYSIEIATCSACVPDCAGKACGDDGCGGTCGAGCPVGQSCSVDQTGCESTPGDDCASAIPIDPSSLPYSGSGDTGAGTDVFQDTGCVDGLTGLSPDIVYSFTAAADGSYTFTVTPSGAILPSGYQLDAVLYVLDACTEGAVPDTCSDGVDNAGDGQPESVTLTVTAGTTYWFVIDSYYPDDSDAFTVDFVQN